MLKVTFIEHDGTEHQVDVVPGDSVMRSALDNCVPGIDGDCGGNRACGTCHVFVDERWLSKLRQPNEEEERLLGFSAVTQANSRLSCQIIMNEALDGLVVRLPEAQH